MKKNVTIICILASLILILDSFNAGYALMLFFCIGVIPGTDIILTPTQMLTLITMLTIVVITRVGILPILRKMSLSNIKTKTIANHLNRV